MRGDFVHERNSMPDQAYRYGPPGVLAAILLLLGLCLCGCSGGDEQSYSPTYAANAPQSDVEYVFAPHPVMNAQKLAEVYGALVDHINARLAGDNIRLRLESSRNYTAFNEKLLLRKVHFALPNPYQTILSQDCGYEIFGKVANDDMFRGIVILRKDSPIRTMADLKGATVSFPAPTALAATLMPELFLKEHGVDPRKDISQLFVGTHESAMLNVAIGTSAAACTWPAAWESFKKDHPDKARTIEVRWQTSTLPHNGLVARADVPEQVRRKVAQAFFALHEDPQGLRILGMANVERFVPADNATFGPVHEFIRRYTSSVRQLKGLHE